MQLDVVKKPGCLVPSTPIDEGYIEQIPNGTLFSIDLRKRRNPKFHRKFWALLSWVHGAQERWDSVDQLLIEIKLKLGYFTLYVTEEGKPVYIPKSISFAAMDQAAFEQFYSKTVDIILRDYMPATKKELDEAVDKIMNFL